MTENKNLQLVQILRGVAALLVVFMHAGENFKKNFGGFFLDDFFRFGGAGVDIFFVLSGFIITYTSYHNISRPEKTGAFIKRRFIRIFPTYWVIATFFLLLQFALPSFYPTKFPSEPGALLSTFFLLPDHIMLNGVSWTLTYEIFFYLTFILAFLVPSRKVVMGIALVYLVSIIIAGIYANSFTGNRWLNLVFFPKIIEFIIGIVAAVIFQRIPKRAAIWLILFGALLFLGSGIFSNMGYYLTQNNFNRVIIFGIPSFLIICGIVRYEMETTIRAPKFLLQLGDGSYSLYLLHLPVLVATCKVLSMLQIQNETLQHVIMLLVIVFLCGISILFYTLIEKPIISYLNSWRRIRVANEI